MNKTELADVICEKVEGINRRQAREMLNMTFENIAKELEEGNDVTILGFGTFITRTRKERKGKKPQTGEPLIIPERQVPVFKAGKSLKDRIAKAFTELT